MFFSFEKSRKNIVGARIKNIYANCKGLETLKQAAQVTLIAHLKKNKFKIDLRNSKVAYILAT